MSDIDKTDITGQLMSEGFQRSSPLVNELSDPLEETMMIVTLDNLKTYDHNPRITRNPLYDEIKMSMKARGLASPPEITRRPGDTQFMILSGGNTRLAIMRELWAETKEERFFRFMCKFMPWVSEVHALTGHLIEGELHGALLYIEKAVGIRNAHEMYSTEKGYRIPYSELVKQLNADGFPIDKSQISRIYDTLEYLLPAIPIALYGGLGGRNIRHLLNLSKAARRFWEQHEKKQTFFENFQALFCDTLGYFDGPPEQLDINRIRDELVSCMSKHTNVDYEEIMLEINADEPRQRALNAPSTLSAEEVQQSNARLRAENAIHSAPATVTQTHETADTGTELIIHVQDNTESDTVAEHTFEEASDLAQSEMDSQTPDTANPHSTTETIIPSTFSGSSLPVPAPQTGQVTPDRVTEIESNLNAFLEQNNPVPAQYLGSNDVSHPAQAEGLYPVTDIWLIERRVDDPTWLRTLMGQLALEISAELDCAGQIESLDSGFGYRCLPLHDQLTPTVRVLIPFLGMVAGQTDLCTPADKQGFSGLHRLLNGAGAFVERLSDKAIIKLFRLIRLSRRLVELENYNPDSI